jgi:hypothetical protein
MHLLECRDNKDATYLQDYADWHAPACMRKHERTKIRLRTADRSEFVRREQALILTVIMGLGDDLSVRDCVQAYFIYQPAVACRL